METIIPAAWQKLSAGNTEEKTEDARMTGYIVYAKIIMNVILRYFSQNISIRDRVTFKAMCKALLHLHLKYFVYNSDHPLFKRDEFRMQRRCR